MRIGLFAPLAGPFATAEYLTTLGTAAEQRGFHSVWVAEHVVLFDDYGSKYPSPRPSSTAARAAGRASR